MIMAALTAFMSTFTTAPAPILEEPTVPVAVKLEFDEDIISVTEFTPVVNAPEVVDVSDEDSEEEEEEEDSEEKEVVGPACGLCRKSGHNRRTCITRQG
jgi:hypothetical protein